MPKYVDHAERRRHIASTAAEMVGRSGLHGLTFRNVATATGYSTTVLTHYFTDKRDLLLSTYRTVAHRWGARFDEAQRDGGLLECLESLLPLDAERQNEWRLLTCYRGVAVSDSELTDEFVGHVSSGTRRIALLLRQERPEMDAVEVDLVSRRLVALVEGLATHAAIDPESWAPATLRGVMAHELDCLDAYARVGGGEPNPIGTEGPTASARRRSGTTPAKRARSLRQAAGAKLRRDVLAAVKHQAHARAQDDVRYTTPPPPPRGD